MDESARRGLDVALAIATAGLAALVVRAAVTTPDDRAKPNDRAALAQDPLNLGALRELGLGFDRRGDLARADSILSFVGRRTWRDGPTEVWLLRRRLDQGRYREAFESADSLLRRDAGGATRPILFQLLAAAADLPEARPALTARLAAGPWWRGDFLTELATRGSTDGAEAVFAALARGPTPPIPDEYGPLIARLARSGDLGGAYAAWRSIVRPGGSAPPALRDGDFTGVSDSTPFTWSSAAGAGASSEIVGLEARAGRSLRVDYDGYSSASLPAQLLVDTPRRYSLVWRQRLDPATPERLFWRVRCADTNQVLARAPRAAPGWRDAMMAVETPPAGCIAQWLELAAAPAERRAPVTGWYAAFRLRPETGAASAHAGAAEQGPDRAPADLEIKPE
jgi:hypothetical protein